MDSAAQGMTDETIAALTDAIVTRLKPVLEARVTQPRLLTVRQTAVYLGRTETATRQLVCSGGLPCVRADGRVMLDIRDLDRWIEDNKTKG